MDVVVVIHSDVDPTDPAEQGHSRQEKYNLVEGSVDPGPLGMEPQDKGNGIGRHDPCMVENAVPVLALADDTLAD